MDDIVAEQEKLDQQLRELIGEQENKSPQKAMTSSEYEHGSNMTSSVNVDNDKFVPVFAEKKKTARSERNVMSNDTSRSERVDSSNWLSQLRSRDQSNQHKQKVNKLHQNEWVDIVDESPRLLPDVNFIDPSSDSEASPDIDHMSDAELLALHRNSFIHPHVGMEDDLPENFSDFHVSEKPPAQQKVKKKLNYKPNTFVPNRTLQLRKSGSLSRIASPEQSDVSSEDLPLGYRDDQYFRNESSRLTEVEKISAKTSRQYRPRPAFR